MTSFPTVVDERRNNGEFDPTKFASVPIHLIGCGALGSSVADLLNCLRIPQLHLWDPDIVAFGNLTNTSYRMHEVEQPKVLALRLALEKKWGTQPINVITHQECVDQNAPLDGVVILAVDRQAARREIFAGLEFNINVQLVIDGRMEARSGEVHTWRPFKERDVELYRDSLVWDGLRAQSDAAGACVVTPGIKATACTVASLMVNQLALWQRWSTPGSTGSELHGRVRVSLHPLRLSALDPLVGV